MSAIAARAYARNYPDLVLAHRRWQEAEDRIAGALNIPEAKREAGRLFRVFWDADRGVKLLVLRAEESTGRGFCWDRGCTGRPIYPGMEHEHGPSGTYPRQYRSAFGGRRDNQR